MPLSPADPGDPGESAPAWPVRPIDASGLLDFTRVGHEAMLASSTPESRQGHRRAITELDRTLAAYDGDTMVGTAMAHSFTMTMPGGARRVAGITAVCVQPTHRRRRVLSTLMRRQLSDIRERGEEAVASLFATEGGIYGRFGYGSAASAYDVALRRGEGVLRADAPRDPALRLRLTNPAEVAAELAAVHDRSFGQRVGEFRRDDRWWNIVLEDPAEERAGFGPQRCALVEDDAGPLGYALYRVKQDWDPHGVPDGKLDLAELHATDPAARALLWEHVLSRDLVSEFTLSLLPVDDALFHLLADFHRARGIRRETLWVRLVDLPRALEERSYAAPVDVVIEVADSACPWNRGRWRLTADTDAARCEPTDRAPDVRLDVAQLGAVYLGGRTLGAALAAGLLAEDGEGAVAALDAALSRSLAPSSAVIF